MNRAFYTVLRSTLEEISEIGESEMIRQNATVWDYHDWFPVSRFEETMIWQNATDDLCDYHNWLPIN